MGFFKVAITVFYISLVDRYHASRITYVFPEPHCNYGPGSCWNTVTCSWKTSTWIILNYGDNNNYYWTSLQPSAMEKSIESLLSCPTGMRENCLTFQYDAKSCRVNLTVSLRPSRSSETTLWTVLGSDRGYGGTQPVWSSASVPIPAMDRAFQIVITAKLSHTNYVNWGGLQCVSKKHINLSTNSMSNVAVLHETTND